ncbi:MAG: hypothetical protein E7568_01525 [Ruminococcaceae bacterium]|nr:hypothetical protein [Oscillospiraceae bacterium]
MAKVPEDKINDLYEIIANLTTAEECKMLFDDLCTHKEIENMAQRIYAAKLLKNGSTYNEVIKETGIASATLARISSCVKYGKGYEKFVK